MNEGCAYRMSSYEPVVEGLIAVCFTGDGWECRVRHRHYSGRFGDCGVAVYDRLTLEELLEVLTATAAQWGPASGVQPT